MLVRQNPVVLEIGIHQTLLYINCLAWIVEDLSALAVTA